MDHKVAILVDYDLFRLSPTLRTWCKSRENKATLVMLVTHPKYHDYKPADPSDGAEAEFPITIRNTASHPDLVFKTSALCVLQDMSDLYPVIAVDANRDIRQMYFDGGAIIVLAENEL